MLEISFRIWEHSEMHPVEDDSSSRTFQPWGSSSASVSMHSLMKTLGAEMSKMKNHLRQTAFWTLPNPKGYSQHHLESMQSKFPIQFSPHNLHADKGWGTSFYSTHFLQRDYLWMHVFSSAGSEEETAAPMSSDGLSLKKLPTNVCFNRPVQLLCKHPHLLASRNFSTSRPSWKEDSTIIALGGDMYRSTSHINETQVILELVPKRSHFEPMGSHNYTCFFHLLGGGTLESNPVLVRPQGMELHVQTPYIRT